MFLIALTDVSIDTLVSKLGKVGLWDNGAHGHKGERIDTRGGGKELVYSDGIHGDSLFVFDGDRFNVNAMMGSDAFVRVTISDLKGNSRTVMAEAVKPDELGYMHLNVLAPNTEELIRRVRSFKADGWEEASGCASAVGPMFSTTMRFKRGES